MSETYSTYLQKAKTWRYLLLASILLLAGCQPIMIRLIGPGIPFEKPAVGFPGWPTPSPEELVSDDPAANEEVISASVAIVEDAEDSSEPGEAQLGLNMAEALACLDEQSTIYGIALANANVRAQPELDGCYMGRVPRERVVRITQVYVQGSDKPFNDDSTADTPADIPTQSNFSVGYIEDIQPIFQRSCGVCHGDEPQSGELKATDYDTLMAGGKSGRVIIPEDSVRSLLWYQVSNGIMPMTGPLPEDEQQLIKTWIDAGAPRQRVENKAERDEEAPSVEIPSGDLWWSLIDDDVDMAPNRCDEFVDTPNALVSSGLILPVGCNTVPSQTILDQVLALSRAELPPTAVSTAVPTAVDTPIIEEETATPTCTWI